MEEQNEWRNEQTGNDVKQAEMDKLMASKSKQGWFEAI